MFSRNKLCVESAFKGSELLLKMNRRSRKENADRYRSRNCLNVPKDIFEVRKEMLSDCMEEYVDDTNFVQATVWLQSATMLMKDISVEQFSLIFNKQWSNSRHTRNYPSIQREISGIEDSDLINDSEYANRIDLSCNINDDRAIHQQQRVAEGRDIFCEKRSNPSTFISFQKLDKSFHAQNQVENEAYVIPDSDEECASCSDIFRDSPASQEANNTMHNENTYEQFKESLSDIITENSMKKFCFISQNSDLSKETFSRRTDYLTVTLDEDDSSDITAFNEAYTLYRQNCNQLEKQLILESDKNCVTSSTYVNNSDTLQKDSAYDTYQLRTQHTPTSAYMIQNNDIDRQSFLSFSQQSRSTDSLKIEYSRRDGYLQKNKASVENTRYESSSNKKRKLESVYKLSEMVRRSKTNGEKISSRWFRTTIEDLNLTDLALQSVRVILLVLQDEKTTRQYMKSRWWKDTLEEKAVNAILNFRDTFEVENKTGVCTQEIVQTVISFIDKSAENTELSKVAISSHQISILSQLCASTRVCVETINHLTVKLKSYENVLVTMMSSKRANVHRVTNQLHTIFHALTLCLRKYRSFPRSKSENELEEVTPAVNLWKKQLQLEGAIVEDSVRMRERRWCKMLDDFTMIAMETNFLQFVERSRALVNMLCIKMAP